MQNRLKSKVFWIGVLSIVVLIMANYGLFDIIGIQEGTFKEIFEGLINLIFTGTSIFAIANNPTSKDSF